MGLFDNNTFRSKDAESIYKELKVQYHSLVNKVDPKNINTKQVDALDKVPAHKQCLKTFKVLLQSYIETTVLFNVVFQSVDLTAEGLLAFLKVMSVKDDKGAHMYPMAKFALNSCRWSYGDRKPTKDFKFNSQQEEQMAQDSEQSFFSLLSEYLRDTKTLSDLELNGSMLQFDTVKSLVVNGIRYNDSLSILSFNDCQFDGSVQCPQLFMGVLLDLAQKRTLLQDNNPLRHSEYRNLSLREVNVVLKNWNSDAMQCWYVLVKECPRLIRVKVALDDQNYKPTADQKPLKFYLDRNHAVQSIIDDVLTKVLKRQFKTKLTNFRESVKQHKVKSPVSDDKGPAYKWIAQSDESPHDPFHPVVQASARFKAGYAMSAGRRSEMQDVLSMQGKFIQRATTDTEDFWAIFDGHGGREAASYAAENLPKLISARLADLTMQPQQRADAIKQAFQECQKQMAPWNTITGTTAVCLYIHDNIRYSINLGDSRMVVYNSKAELAELLTKDHRPNVPEEAERILALKGGFVQDGRVNGKLQVSRSLGDSSLSPYTSCIPDVTFAPVSDNDEFVVLASDGLWDVFAGTGADVAERHTFKGDGNLSIWLKGLKEVSSIVLSSPTASAAAKKLCELAYNKGSTDNISVIVVFLKFNPKKDKVAGASDKVPSAVPLKDVPAEKKSSQSSLTQSFDKTQAKIANPLFNSSKASSLNRPVPAKVLEVPIDSPQMLRPHSEQEESPTSTKRPPLPSRKNKRSTVISPQLALDTVAASDKVLASQFSTPPAIESPAAAPVDPVQAQVPAQEKQVEPESTAKSPPLIASPKPAMSLTDIRSSKNFGSKASLPPMAPKPDNLRSQSLYKINKSASVQSVVKE